MPPPRVLVACEYSGIVRDAFLAVGCDAWSCDVICTTRNPARHIRNDVRDVLNAGWDLLIAHPPCTYLSCAGNAWWNRAGRETKRDEAIAFFLTLARAPVPKICIENPQGILNTVFRKPDQVVNPYDFGTPIRKRTCLWLFNLPHLKPTNPTPPPPPITIDKPMTKSEKRRHYTEAIRVPRYLRQQRRSLFFPAIARAMAAQWTL